MFIWSNETYTLNEGAPYGNNMSELKRLISDIFGKLKNKKNSEKKNIKKLNVKTKKPDKNVSVTFRNATKEDLERLENNDDFFIDQGLTVDENSKNAIANFIIDSYNPKDDLEFIIITGKLMNDTYDLHDYNRYPDDSHFYTFNRDAFPSSMTGSIKGRLNARYFGDVVRNNEDREVEMGYRK